MGLLYDASGQKVAPSALEATNYLPSLHNLVWEKSAEISDIPETVKMNYRKTFNWLFDAVESVSKF